MEGHVGRVDSLGRVVGARCRRDIGGPGNGVEGGVRPTMGISVHECPLKAGRAYDVTADVERTLFGQRAGLEGIGI